MGATPMPAIVDDQRTLADKVCSQLKQEIISGELPQGAKIREEELAKKYGISRGPLREAIRRLEGMNLVDRIPHAGARVVTLTYERMADIYAVREAMEGTSARLAAERMTRDEIGALWRLLEEHEAAIEETHGKEYFQQEGDFDFHFRIAQGSRNKWLIQHLSSELYQLMRMCRRRSSQMPDRPTTALKEHRHIVEVIAMRDGELAEILMRRHIRGAWEVLKDLLPQDQND